MAQTNPTYDSSGLLLSFCPIQTSVEDLCVCTCMAMQQEFLKSFCLPTFLLSRQTNNTEKVGCYKDQVEGTLNYLPKLKHTLLQLVFPRGSLK
jgi:hypothetical protein